MALSLYFSLYIFYVTSGILGLQSNYEIDVAQGKPAVQSSTFIETYPRENSSVSNKHTQRCLVTSPTKSDKPHWWKVNLQGHYHVHKVNIQTPAPGVWPDTFTVSVGEFEDDINSSFVACAAGRIGKAASQTLLCSGTGTSVGLQWQPSTAFMCLSRVRVYGTCAEGFYSSGCNKKCSVHCKHSRQCSTENGYCQCKTGFLQPTCHQACSRGHYGDSCKKQCSVGCRHHTCHHVDGTCYCRPGYKGSKCDAVCAAGRWGQNCSSTCHCGEGHTDCMRTDGSCISKTCQAGWSGPTCQKQDKPHSVMHQKNQVAVCPTLMYTSIIAVLSVLVLGLLIFVFILWKRLIKVKQITEKEDSRYMDLLVTSNTVNHEQDLTDSGAALYTDMTSQATSVYQNVNQQNQQRNCNIYES